jgi:hypothetical protein
MTDESMDETAAAAAAGAAGSGDTANNVHSSDNNSTSSSSSSSSTTAAAAPPPTVVPQAQAPQPTQQLQQRRRPNYFFRTMSSIGTDAGGGWGSGGDSTPRSAGDHAGYAAGQGLRQLGWSLLMNAALALLLLGLVEAVVLPILVASMELTPLSPRVAKLLTALLTAHLFQAGARGTLLLLLAVGGSALGLAVTGAFERGFVPLFLACYIVLHTLAPLAAGSTGGGGASSLPTASGGGIGIGGSGGGLKTLSETSSARERGWSPVGRWRLWGA